MLAMKTSELSPKLSETAAALVDQRLRQQDRDQVIGSCRRTDRAQDADDRPAQLAAREQAPRTAAASRAPRAVRRRDRPPSAAAPGCRSAG